MKVSVIIPTYNYSHYIQQAIDSVLSQDYPTELVEVIVVDDGSTDNTRKVLAEISKGAPTVQYHYQENAGKAAATQIGIALAGGEIIFNLDADDWFLPGKISKTVQIFRHDPTLAHVASPALIHWQDGSRAPEAEPISFSVTGQNNGEAMLRYFMERKMLFGGGSTFAARAAVLKQIEWQATIDMYTDEWLLINTLLQGGCYFFLEPLSVWRVHGSNYSGSVAQGRQQQKQERLKKSSTAILQLVQKGKYPGWLKNTYRLKHEVRLMVWREEMNEKSTGDVFRFLWKGIFSGNSISVLRSYHAFNRLAPMGLMKWLRRDGR
ncbi:hypothetical protein BH10BAC3_BH10BAC3_33820 [soil metagenome]